MRKGLEFMLIGALSVLAGARISGCKYHEKPARESVQKTPFEQFAEAYKESRYAGYSAKLNPTEENKEAQEKAEGKLESIRAAQGIEDNIEHFRNNGMLCFEAKPHYYAAKILDDTRKINGVKIYIVSPKSSEHSVKTFEGFRGNTNISTIFKDTNGEYAMVVNYDSAKLSPTKASKLDSIEENHRLFGKEGWEGTTEALYAAFKDIPKDQREEKALNDSLNGTINHEFQHILDRKNYSSSEMSLHDRENRGHLKGLIANPSELYDHILRAINKPKTQDGAIDRARSLRILGGLFRIYGVNSYSDFYKKLYASGNPREELKRGAEMLWNVWYAEKK